MVRASFDRPSAQYPHAKVFTGWIITLMDHEGPNSAYAYGPQAGKAVLDSVRATIAFGPAIGLDPTAKAVLWGYSGGAIAVSWAEALVNSYAPELHIVGGAHGGTPASLQPCVELIVSLRCSLKMLY
mgnify:CR=1 FL=1